MLRYFFTRKHIPSIKTPEATCFELLSAEEFSNETIPFSHIYITSDSYLKLIKNSLEEVHQKSIIDVSNQQSTLIEKQENFPINISNIKIDSIKELHGLFKNMSHINIGVINGIGLSFKDNLVGLGIIQRLAKLLKPATVTIHLMQSLNERFTQVYTNKVNSGNLQIKIHNNCTSVDNFFKLDGYVDLTGKMNYEEYSEMSLASFYATAFSVENLIPTNNIQPKIATDKNKSHYYKNKLSEYFTEKRPVILFDSQATDSLRSCSLSVTNNLIEEMVKQNYNVLSNSQNLNDSKFCFNYNKIAKNLDDLTHLIPTCDAVITVASPTSHLAPALGKPTILLPTVKSDINNAKFMPEVLQWLPKSSESLYIEKSENEIDTEALNKIWGNIDARRLVEAIQPFTKQFKEKGFRSIRKDKTKRVGIIILATDYKETNLVASMDNLINLPEVDPLWIYQTEAKNSNACNTLSINKAIEKAIKDHCEYIWIVSDNINPSIDFLTHGLKSFSNNKQVGMISGAISDDKTANNIVNAGGVQFMPKSTYESGPASNYKLKKASRKLWVDFESTLLRTEMLTEIGILDEKFETEFKEIDLCLRAALSNWIIYYDPKCKSYRSTAFEKEQKINFNSDVQVFFKKWGAKVKCENINNLNASIRKHIKKHILNNMSQ